MTLDEMKMQAIRHWKTYHRKLVKNWMPEDFQREAQAAAELTRQEMDDLKMIGLDERTAWTEVKTLYCIAPPPQLRDE